MDVFKLAAKITLDTSEYESALAEEESRTSSFGTKIGKAVKTVGKVAGAGLVAATTAAAGFGVSSVKTGQEFDAAMSQVSATLGMTTSDIQNNVDGAGDRFAALREKALEMGSSTMYSATQASEGLNILAMSGYDADQSISMIGDVLHLAAAGSMEMADAAGYVSGTMKGFNDETKTSQYYADLMAKGATLANTSVAQLGEAMSSGAATAASYGQEADSMTISLLRLAEQGEVGSAAGTALAAAMKNLYTPTDQAKKALDELGVNAFDPTTGKARDFNTVVDELDAALSGYTDEQKAAYKQTIFGIQGLDAFNKMTVTGTEKQNKWKEALKAASDGAGEAAKQYNTMTDNLKGDITSMQSALEGFQIALSDQLTPHVRDFFQFATDGISSLTKAFQEGGLTGFFSELGTVITDALAMIVEKIPEFVNAGIALIEALAQGIIQAGPTILNAVEQTIFIVLTQVLGVTDETAQSVVGVIDTAINTIVGILSAIGGAIDKVLGAIGDLDINWSKVWDTVGIVISDAGEIISEVIGVIGDVIAQAIGWFGDLVTEAQTDGTALNEIWNKVQTYFETAWNAIHTVADTVCAAVTGLMEGLGATFDWLASQAETDGTLINTVWENIQTCINTALDVITGLIEAFVQMLTGDWEGAFDTINNTTDTYMNGISDIIDNTMNFIGDNVSKVLSNIAQWFSEKLNNAYDTASRIFGNIHDTIESKINAARDAVGRAIDTMKGFFNFTWSLPRIALPHFSISGRFSLNPPSVPSFSVSWYRKAMDEAYMLSGATIFGAMGNKLLGGGEAGHEMIIGRDSLMEMIREASGGGGGNNVTINVYQREGEDSVQLAKRIQQVMVRQEKQRQVAHA